MAHYACDFIRSVLEASDKVAGKPSIDAIDGSDHWWQSQGAEPKNGKKIVNSPDGKSPQKSANQALRRMECKQRAIGSMPSCDCAGTSVVDEAVRAVEDSATGVFCAALDEIRSLENDSVAMDGLLSGMKNLFGGGGAKTTPSTPNAPQAPQGPVSASQQLTQSLADHDKKNHPGGYKGGRCSYRENVAKVAQQMKIDPKKVGSLNGKANEGGARKIYTGSNFSHQELQTPAFLDYKQKMSKIHADLEAAKKKANGDPEKIKAAEDTERKQYESARLEFFNAALNSPREASAANLMADMVADGDKAAIAKATELAQNADGKLNETQVVVAKEILGGVPNDFSDPESEGAESSASAPSENASEQREGETQTPEEQVPEVDETQPRAVQQETGGAEGADDGIAKLRSVVPDAKLDSIDSVRDFLYERFDNVSDRISYLSDEDISKLAGIAAEAIGEGDEASFQEKSQPIFSADKDRYDKRQEERKAELEELKKSLPEEAKTLEDLSERFDRLNDTLNAEQKQEYFDKLNGDGEEFLKYLQDTLGFSPSDVQWLRSVREAYEEASQAGEESTQENEDAKNESSNETEAEGGTSPNLPEENFAIHEGIRKAQRAAAQASESNKPSELLNEMNAFMRRKHGELNNHNELTSAQKIEKLGEAMQSEYMDKVNEVDPCMNEDGTPESAEDHFLHCKANPRSNCPYLRGIKSMSPDSIEKMGKELEPLMEVENPAIAEGMQKLENALAEAKRNVTEAHSAYNSSSPENKRELYKKLTDAQKAYKDARKALSAAQANPQSLVDAEEPAAPQNTPQSAPTEVPSPTQPQNTEAPNPEEQASESNAEDLERDGTYVQKHPESKGFFDGFKDATKGLFRKSASKRQTSSVPGQKNHTPSQFGNHVPGSLAEHEEIGDLSDSGTEMSSRGRQDGKLPNMVGPQQYSGNTPTTDIYEPVPADERDTSFMEGKKSQIQRRLQDAGIGVDFVKSYNGPSMVQFEVQRTRDGTADKLREALDKMQEDLGVTISYTADTKSGKERYGTITINNPNARDAGLRRLLENEEATKKAKKMRSPMLAGEDAKGNPIWVDLKEHGFIGGDSGMGKSQRIIGGLAGAVHVKSPNEIQYMINAHLNSPDFDFMKGLPHTMSIADSVDKVADNFKLANNELQRRDELFKKEGVANIDDYNEKMRQTGRADQILPQLQIVTDEVTNLLQRRPELEKEMSQIVTNGRKFGISHLGATQDMGAKNMDTGLRGKVRMGVKTRNQHDSPKIFNHAVPELMNIEEKGGLMMSDGDNPIRLRGTYASKENLKRLSDYLKRAWI